MHNALRPLQTFGFDVVMINYTLKKLVEVAKIQYNKHVSEIE